MLIKIDFKIVLLISILIVLLLVLGFLISINTKLNYVKNNSNPQLIPYPLQNNNETSKPIQNITSPAYRENMQSDFFMRSISHAENVAKGNIDATDYITENKQGSYVVHNLKLLNEKERNDLCNCINYYLSDPMLLSDTEKMCRTISVTEHLPLWIAILREAMRKNNIEVNSNNMLKVM